MADELPQARAGGLHIQSGHGSVLQALSGHTDALVRESVPMHMEGVAIHSVC